MSRPPEPSHSLWFALVVWAGASVAALVASSYGLIGALAVACLGGAVFGWLSARRLDGRRVRARRRREAEA